MIEFVAGVVVGSAVIVGLGFAVVVRVVRGEFFDEEVD